MQSLKLQQSRTMVEYENVMNTGSSMTDKQRFYIISNVSCNSVTDILSVNKTTMCNENYRLSNANIRNPLAKCIAKL